MWVFLRCLERFDETDARQYGAINAGVSLLGTIEDSEFERIHSDLLTDLVNNRLDRKCGIGCPGGTVCGRFRFIDYTILSIDQYIFDVVTRVDAHRSSANR